MKRLQRGIALLLITVMFAACDPGREISATKIIPSPLNKTCVIETLRMQDSSGSRHYKRIALGDTHNPLVA